MLPAARSDRDEMGEQESRANVYLTSRENKEAQHMGVYSRVNKDGTQPRQQQGCNVLRGLGRSVLSPDKQTVVDRNKEKERYYSQQTRGNPGHAAASVSSVSCNQKKNMSNGHPVSQPTPLHQLSLLLETQPETFTSGSREIQHAALRSTEHIFNLGALVALSRLRVETLTTFM